MNITAELKHLIQTAIAQLTARSPGSTTRQVKPSLTFTRNFYQMAKQYSLSEQDARDVYYHGSFSAYKTKAGNAKMYKAYNGYQISISYFNDSRTDTPVISAIWKRETAH